MKALRLGIHGRAVIVEVDLSEIADKLSGGTLRHIREIRKLTPARARYYARRLLWLADRAEEAVAAPDPKGVE